ncbi:putative ATP-dependent RNA helicase DHX33 [Pseudomyrmex gracilis]|uniref:putative ATP-dependent RNA helicase DHX33 n=1 Tax=Pseudomyrmex gracilis TaxID=219809 RepID=UPI000995A093|nr:putative ATP-dependent RNA helicase DHX33 [Pseudomyrmex gracilis]
MKVHDDVDSKYNVMGKSKLNLKRPNTVLFNNHSNKMQKNENTSSVNAMKNGDKASSKLQQQRKSLPVYMHRKRLLKEIYKNGNTLIIIGETGSGKSTQIPQLLHDHKVTNGCIGITQPRRIAAVSIARRVAQERGICVGTLVGYCVRFEDCTSAQTKIKYMTDGMMVREAMKDEILSDYSVVILDEAHERSIHTDILFGVAKRAQTLRKLKNLPPLRLLIMSATMDPVKFKEYFQAPALYLEGRQHPVRIFHAVSPQLEYAFNALVTAIQIHRDAPANEDILIFLTGQDEIEAAVIAARQMAKDLDRDGYPPLKVFSLYAALPTHQQLEAFKPSAPGMRKLVISTNIAETSVTIGGIRYVIDSGVVKVRTHHPTTGLDMLRVEKVSKAQAWQRTGRAGREAPGKCYRVFTLQEFEKMKEMPVPEIQRCSLAGVALQLLAISIDITNFDFMDKPPKEGIDVALNCLEKLGAIRGSPPQLTTLGRTMSLFPLEPRFTKVILASVEHRCLEEALTVIALLSSESIFMDPPMKREEAYKTHSRFSSPEGDHVTLLNVFRAYQNSTSKKAWCHENFLHHRNLVYASEVRQQLAAIAERANLEKASCETNTKQLRKALLEGLYENLAELQRDKTYVTVYSKQPVAIHPYSMLHDTKHPLLLFTEIIATGRCYIRGLSVIDPAWLTQKNTCSGKHD